MRYVVDLDGVLCEQREDMDYENARPKTDQHFRMIEWVRAKHRAGHEITIWTGRGSGSTGDWEPETREQLQRWSIPYDHLSVGEKPVYDVLVDDRSRRPEDIVREAV